MMDELKEKLEVLKRQWVEETGDIKDTYSRIVGDYLITVSCWSEERELLDEVMRALSEEIPFVDEIVELYWMVEESLHCDLSILIYDDGSIETIHHVFQWFHGQGLVNVLVKKLGFELKADYEGETTIRSCVGRPITHEKLCEAMKRLYYGIQLYHMIKRAQETAAINVTLSFINTLQREAQG